MAKKNQPVQEPEEQGWDNSSSPAPADDSASEGQEVWNEVPDNASTDEEVWEDSAIPLTLNIQTHSGSFNPDEAKILIYGETGTQKTRFASTFPDVLFIDVDHGMNSVDRQVDKVFVEDNEAGFRQMRDAYMFLKNSQHGYSTVVLDTLNEMQRVIMRFTVEEYTHIRRSYGNLPGQSDYGKMLYEFTELVRNFISLPMRVVLLAQVNSQQFDTDILMPQLVGKNSAREIARKMDVIGFIHKVEEAEGTAPAISFDSQVYMTKDRSNKLPQLLLHPSYSRMSAFWK